jgi:hypothetical protein
MPQNIQTRIEISGTVDQSLPAAIGLTTQELMKLQKAVNTTAQLSNKINLNAIGFGALPEKLKQANVQASRMQDIWKDISKTAAGFALGGAVVKGVEAMASGAEAFYGWMMKASNASANMQLQRAEMKGEFGLSDAQQKSMDAYFWQRSIQVPVTVPSQMEGARLIGTAIQETDPDKKMQLVKAESEMIQNLAAATVKSTGPGESLVNNINEQYKSMALLISNMQKYGVTLENRIKPLESAGLNLRPDLLLAKGMISQDQRDHWSSMSTDERDSLLGDLAKDIHKRKLLEGAVMDVLWSENAPGGKLYGRAAQIAQTTGGVESSTADVVNFFETRVGDIINGPLTELLGKINSGFAGELPHLQGFFDKLSETSSKALKPFFDSLANANWSKNAEDMTKLGEALDKVISRMGPMSKMLGTELLEEIDDLTRLATAIMNIGAMIEKAFNWTLGMGDRGGAFDSLQWSKAAQDGGYRVHAFADGGIVNGATLGLLGEAGSEAVIPLDSFQDVVSTIAELNDTMQKFLYGTSGGSSGGFGLSSGYGGSRGGLIRLFVTRSQVNGVRRRSYRSTVTRVRAYARFRVGVG